MCGIAAILYKADYGAAHPSVGAQLRDMLYSMRHRGVDSTGVTIAGERVEADYMMRLTLPKQESERKLALKSVQRVIDEMRGSVQSLKTVDEFCKLAFDYRGDLRPFGDRILQIDGVQIHSIGRTSEVIKDVGDAMDLDRKHHISEMNGTHGVGHVRLATESEVDITHSHPFWAYPFPDITVVHNGQLTNYHKLKREFQERGFRFQTHNDSEVIAVYIADKLSRKEKLRDVLLDSLDDLDGTFTYVVSTESGIGMAKDRWSAKPFLILETSDMVGLASEEVALRRVFPDDIPRLEPQEHEVLSWSCAPTPVIGSR